MHFFFFFFVNIDFCKRLPTHGPFWTEILKDFPFLTGAIESVDREIQDDGHFLVAIVRLVRTS